MHGSAALLAASSARVSFRRVVRRDTPPLRNSETRLSKKSVTGNRTSGPHLLDRLPRSIPNADRRRPRPRLCRPSWSRRPVHGLPTRTGTPAASRTGLARGSHRPPPTALSRTCGPLAPNPLPFGAPRLRLVIAQLDQDPDVLKSGACKDAHWRGKARNGRSAQRSGLSDGARFGVPRSACFGCPLDWWVRRADDRQDR